MTQTTGQWNEGRREGFGRAGYRDGAEYAGEWSHDLPNGKGTIRCPSGLVEEYSVRNFHIWRVRLTVNSKGEWLSGEWHGCGQMVSRAGWTIKGVWDR